MQKLSQDGQQAIDDISRRTGFSFDAVFSMLQSIINGNGSMAQFNHPEFGGSGQWMSGGMTMLSDMFNNHLKNRVDNLCSELARLVASQPDLLRSGSFQSQSQGGQQQNNYAGDSSYANNSGQNNSNSASPVSLFVPPAPGASLDWWPADLRWPNSTGAQNDVRYAYFAQACRLVIEVNGTVTVYDTLDHQIGGFSQQQSWGGSLSFSSQYGLIDVASLPVVSVDGVPPAAPFNRPESSEVPVTESFATAVAPELPVFATAPNLGATNAGESDIFVMIEKLADLRTRSLLSEEEFVSKKTELLARL